MLKKKKRKKEVIDNLLNSAYLPFEITEMLMYRCQRTIIIKVTME